MLWSFYSEVNGSLAAYNSLHHALQGVRRRRDLKVITGYKSKRTLFETILGYKYDLEDPEYYTLDVSDILLDTSKQAILDVCHIEPRRARYRLMEYGDIPAIKYNIRWAATILSDLGLCEFEDYIRKKNKELTYDVTERM